jgi:hypothetical protein
VFAEGEEEEVGEEEESWEAEMRADNRRYSLYLLS